MQDGSVKKSEVVIPPIVDSGLAKMKFVRDSFFHNVFNATQQKSFLTYIQMTRR